MIILYLVIYVFRKNEGVFGLICITWFIMLVTLIVSFFSDEPDDSTGFFIAGIIISGFMLYSTQKSVDKEKEDKRYHEMKNRKWEEERPEREEKAREEKIRREKEEQKEKERIQQIKKTEETAMNVVKNYENANGRYPKDISSENLGYDIKSSNSNETRLIEVKGLANDSSGEYILLTSNEWKKAEELERAYWLYVVTNCANRIQKMYIVQSPYNKLNAQYISEQNKYKIYLTSLLKFEIKSDLPYLKTNNTYTDSNVIKEFKHYASTAHTSTTEMVYVEGGAFQMGSDTGGDDEKPVHSVTVSSFYMGKYPVTQKEWQAVMGSNPSRFTGDKSPVESITWYQAVEFCNKLSQKEGLTPAYTINGTNVSCNWNADGYRLPTEAEWEFAARGGKLSKGYSYSGSNNLDEVGWYDSNSSRQTKDVGTKRANELGIYDMSGIVWEWCWDWYGDYSSSAETNPRGATSGSCRVVRGGCWGGYDYGCQVARRGYVDPDDSYDIFGFRLSRPVR